MGISPCEPYSRENKITKKLKIRHSWNLNTLAIVWSLVAHLQEILKFSALRLNCVAILTYHLTGCPTLLASNKIYHFSNNLIKVYFIYLRSVYPQLELCGIPRENINFCENKIAKKLIMSSRHLQNLHASKRSTIWYTLKPHSHGL